MPANETKPFVRTADTKGQGQRYKLGSAFANAGRGLVEAVRGERNLRIDAGFAVIAILLGFALRIDTALAKLAGLLGSGIVGESSLVT